MTGVLEEEYGIDRLELYRKMGPTLFFSDYINLYNRDKAIPNVYHLSDHCWSDCIHKGGSQDLPGNANFFECLLLPLG